ncbi:MAG TPA: DJ-1/PfpI family protein, partial [Terrimicrobiaceae bacterium]
MTKDRLKAGVFNPRIVLVAVPPVIEFDLAALADVFTTANHFLAEDRRYTIEVVSSSSQSVVEGECGLRFAGARHYTTLKGSIDTLVIAGVHPWKVRLSPGFLAWLRTQAAETRRVASVTTGSYVIAEAGLLDGKRAATHWAFAKKMAARFPAVKVDPDP